MRGARGPPTQRLHSNEGKASESLLPKRTLSFPYAGHSAPTFLDLQALSHCFLASPLCMVPLFLSSPSGRGIVPLAPSIHATLYFPSFYLGPSPLTPIPAFLQSPRDGQLPSSYRAGSSVASPKQGSSAHKALFRVRAGHGSRRKSGAEKGKTFLGSACSMVPAPASLPASLSQPGWARVIYT